jgi:hypothetical protein
MNLSFFPDGGDFTLTPALTAAKLSPTKTARGVGLVVVVPLPSSPSALLPQQ